MFLECLSRTFLSIVENAVCTGGNSAYGNRSKIIGLFCKQPPLKMYIYTGSHCKKSSSSIEECIFHVRFIISRFWELNIFLGDRSESVEQTPVQMLF